MFVLLVKVPQCNWWLWCTYFGSGCSWGVPLCPVQRITIEEIRNDEWFKKGYVPVKLLEYEDVNLDDLDAVFDDCEVGKVWNAMFFPVYDVCFDWEFNMHLVLSSP